MFPKMTPALTLTLPLLLAGVTACYVEVRDDEDDASKSPAQTRITHPDELPPSLRGTAEPQTCQETGQSPSGGKTWYCYKTEDYSWRTSCKSETCQEVHVFAHYMLTEDLGQGRVVQVEAFDNSHFEGAPVSTVRVGNFQARTGEWKEATLFLQPGEYYLRAYMTTKEDSSTTPYSLGDMTLVSEKPVGVFGAASGAESVRVAPRAQDRYPSPVHIYLDKLFKKPGSEPDTNAHLRIALNVAQGAKIPDGRKVLIQLRKTADMATAPAQSFDVATELLLVQGRVGKAEFVSPSLPEGDYVVLAFIDANANGYYDEAEEAGQVYTLNQQVAAVKIKKDRTESIALTLQGGARGDDGGGDDGAAASH